MQGYNGSQLWDTAFAVQAVIATNLAAEYSTCLRAANMYISSTQVLLTYLSMFAVHGNGQDKTAI